MATHDNDDRASRADDGRRSRSTPLRPAVWMTSVLVWATVIALILGVPTWAGIFLCALTGVSFLWFLGSYVYLFATDREALRVERWRGPTARTSTHNAATQQLSEDQERYLGPEPARFAVKGTGADEARVSVGATNRMKEQ